MAENSGIEWTHHTFNPWRGCTKISPGCEHCYAEAGSHRNPAVLGEWGPGAKRVEAAESYWREPYRWYEKARALGERHRVFCASLADVFDKEAPTSSRRRLWETIQATSGYLNGFQGGGLDWLLLTKRPERIGDVRKEDGFRPGFFRENRCWMGVSVESQPYTKRIWAVDHWGYLTFVSAEPLLGPFTMPNALAWTCACGATAKTRIPTPGVDRCAMPVGCHGPWQRPPVDWVIAGGESGPDARPMHPEWVRWLRDGCNASGVPFFFKQWGEWIPTDQCTPALLPARSYPDEMRETLAKPTRRIDLNGKTIEVGTIPGLGGTTYPDALVRRVGKKAAGRLLDGRTWDELPTSLAQETAS